MAARNPRRYSFERSSLKTTSFGADVSDWFLHIDPPSNPPPEWEFERLLTYRDRLRACHLPKIWAQQHPKAFLAEFHDILGIGSITGDPRIAPLLRFLEALHDDLLEMVMTSKRAFDLGRPYQFDPSILGDDEDIEKPDYSAYPSGHATQSMFVALGFETLVGAGTDRAKQGFEAAHQIGVNREIAGLHFPSDTAAGVEFASWAFRRVRDTRRFKEMLEDARQALAQRHQD